MKPITLFVAAASLHASICAAVPVSVKGEFLSFTGPAFEVSTSPDFNTTMNGVVLTPSGVVDVGQVGRVGTATHLFAPGTSSVTFQNTEGGPPNLANVISFAGTVDLDGVVPGVSFRLGVFSLTNGIWFRSDLFQESAFGFRMTTMSADPALDGHTFDDTIRFHSTPFNLTLPDGTVVPATPDQNADFAYFLGRPDLGSMRVFEADAAGGGNTGMIGLDGKISSLIPTAFIDITTNDGAFVSPSTGDLRAAVPTPGTLLLALLGMGILGMVRRARAIH
jgi:hypothetical protein